MHIFFVVLSVFLVMRLVRMLVWRRRGWHGRGGCGRGHGHWGYRRGPLGFLIHELELDRQQRDILEAIVHDVQRSGSDLRFGGRRLAREAAFAVASDNFDRAHLEDGAKQQESALGSLRGRLVDGLERLSASLRPDQKDRLRVMAQRFWGAGPAAAAPVPAAPGPYRS